MADRDETPTSIIIDDIGPKKFALTVMFGGEQFQCGDYVSHSEAQKAGKMFVGRKEAEQIEQRKRPRGWR